MKSFVRGALAIALLGSVSATAFAADLPSRKEAPVYIAPAPVFSWTGFYVGAEFGGQWGNNSTSLVNNYTGNTLLTTGSYNTSGVVGGGLVGYNYQINQFVLGVEGDLTGSSNQGRFSTNAFGLAASQNSQYGFGAGVRGRLGFALDHTLIYATGGWAYETIDQTYNNTYHQQLPAAENLDRAFGLHGRRRRGIRLQLQLERPPRIPLDRLRQVCLQL